MVTKRKIMVWLITLAAVVLVYILYNWVVDSPSIQVYQGNDSATDIEMPEFGAQIGETKVGKVEKARFTVLDEKTKKLKRVFGFEKLLNPNLDDEKWKLQKPYMDIYDEKFICEIESERGDVQVETIAGKYSPTDAQLYENVTIDIYPVGSGKISKSTIYLDDLAYNSERSEFSTSGPVKMVSEDGVLEGFGLLLVYNNELTRIEYMRISELSYLRLMNISKEKSFIQPEKELRTEIAEEPATIKDKPEEHVVQQIPHETSTGGVEPLASVSEQKSQEGDLYKFQFNKKVVIEYGSELVVTGKDYIAINNIVWSESSDEKDPGKDTRLEAPSEAGPSLSKSATEETSPAKSQIQGEAKKPVQDGPISTSSEADATEVMITCHGSLIIKPINSLISPNETDENLETIQRKQIDIGPADSLHTIRSLKKLYAEYTSSDPEEAASGDLWPDTLFHARTIDYDKMTGNAMALAPVKFIFYSKDDNNAEFSAVPTPSIITAAKNTEFFADKDQTINRIVFNGDVVGTRKTQTPAYLQKNSFFGQQLIVDLAPGRENSSETNIKHITVRDGKVKLESQRLVNELTLNHVRLTCSRIDYGTDDEIVIATGPGDIQINNENAPALEKDNGAKISLKRPCFALIDGFDKLEWSIPDNYITADGKSKSVNMAYLPIVNGEKGDIVRASTTHLKADFIETVTGRNELTSLKTSGGIYYKEQGGNELIGNQLLYNVENSLMTITGSQEQQCFANGALVPRIEYDLQTGNINTKLSTSPGAISFPAHKKKK